MAAEKGYGLARRIRPVALLAWAALALVAVGAATAEMTSERISRYLCETTGGGRFVDIPGFPGEKIDRRLKRDIRFLRRRYNIFITDGHSTDPVHSANGEHPLGLALDIVPNKAEGGTWRDITRLARWAEPEQDRPRAPFRWVGYDGDPGHGKRHHLHLSWSHSPAKFNRPARTVWTIKCPTTGTSSPDDGGTKDGDGSGGGTSGGISSRSGAGDGSGGGISPRIARIQPESGGVALR